MIVQLINILSRFFSLFIPRKDIMVFNSFPDLSDNSYAIFEYLIKNQQELNRVYTFVYLFNDKKPSKKDYNYLLERGISIEKLKNVRFEKKMSIKGLYYFCSAKYVFSSHGILEKINLKNQTRVNLWHGMPIKNIAKLDGKAVNEIHVGDFFISTSSFYRDIMAKSFNVSIDKVNITGQPRNDYLFQAGERQKIKLRPFILWMPTYRKSRRGDIRLDGSYSEGDFFDADSVESINYYLKENDLLLLLKLHPMDYAKYNIYKNQSNILFIDEDWLFKRSIQLYELIKESEALITDYSSVYVDYLLTKKPVAFIQPDLNDYINSRGLVFNSSNDIFIGTKVSSSMELIGFFETVKHKVNLNEEAQEMLSDKLNYYKDGHSSKRIIKDLNLFK
ncbi:CDP-glycerol glycerophosphotransferase family protein [Psychrobacillus sp. MER TA 17]|nr:CDP-glycerol glycerophosphotransferase family protein [Psychrobacillus sp. MER TA 17]